MGRKKMRDELPRGPDKKAGQGGHNRRGGMRTFAESPKAQEQFLRALARTGRMWQSYEIACVSPAAVLAYRQLNPQFDQAVKDAMDQYCELLEKEIHRRGVDGVDEPVFYLGSICGYVRRYSDKLLMEHAKRHIPAYRQQVTLTQHLSHSGLGMDMESLSPENQQKLQAILESELERRNEASKQSTVDLPQVPE